MALQDWLTDQDDLDREHEICTSCGKVFSQPVDFDNPDLLCRLCDSDYDSE